jgi:hypothetical protein
MSTTKNKTITVHAPPNMTLEQAQKVLANVLNKAGHPGCYSGFNINFVNMGDPAPLVLNVEQGSLNISQMGR